jgi:phosphoesterase RecJ-like protein
MDFRQLEIILKEKESFLITTHVNPDADAIGSEMALYKILQKFGKNIKIINYSETPYYLQFLDDSGIIEKYDETIHSCLFNNVDVIIAVDFNRSDRIVKMQQHFLNSKATKICIDHHQDPEDFCDYFFCSTQFAATGQIIYSFIEQTRIIEIDLSIAIPIYAAIMTDTGSFRFERTNSEIHKIAAKLLEVGVNPTNVYQHIYDESNFGKIKLLGEAINSIKLYGENQELAVMVVHQEALIRNGVIEGDTDGFINLCMTIKGVKIALKFMELNDGFKVSLRSKGEIPVHKFALKYGGGGHTNAAGIRFRNANMSDQMHLIIDSALEFISHHMNKKQ